MKYIFAIYCLFLVAACQSDSPKIQDKRPILRPANISPFFDLTQYFKQEAQRLSAQKIKTEKIVFANHKTETKSVENTVWRTYFELFKNSDINKAIWINSYQIDSISKPNTIIYTALEKKLKTQKMEIQKQENGRIKGIYIWNQSANKVYDADQELIYLPDSLLIIKHYQQAIAQKKSEYTITLKIKK